MTTAWKSPELMLARLRRAAIAKRVARAKVRCCLPRRTTTKAASSGSPRRSNNATCRSKAATRR
eukprot:682689-Alexandrium_andersonii.AAC.1